MGEHDRSGTAVRWLVWGGCVAGWTAALLTTFPAHVHQSLLPRPAQFPTAKLLHVSAYAFLTALAFWPPLCPRRRWLPVAVLSLHGFVTEFLQQWVDERHGSLRDVGLDHAGIALGLLLVWAWRRTVSSSPGRRPVSGPAPDTARVSATGTATAGPRPPGG